MKSKILTFPVIAMAFTLIFSVASAWGGTTIYFADNFKSGLGQWQPGSGGVITSDPLGVYGQVLTFDRLWFGGDIWSKVTVPAGSYLSFDYMGFGGFIGTDAAYEDPQTDWLAGQQGYGGIEQTLTYDNTWRHYEVQVRTTGYILAEDWGGTTGQQSPAYFANIVVASYPNASFPSASQVSGRVYNSAGATIAGASIQIGSSTATCGSDGSYSITGLVAGNYPVTVSATGYTTLSSTLAVLVSAHISQNFTLNPVPVSGSLSPVTVSTKYNPDGKTVIYFLDGVTFPVTFTASVNWGSSSGHSVIRHAKLSDLSGKRQRRQRGIAAD